MFFFEKSKLLAVAAAKRNENRTAAPFPFLVIDGLLPDHFAQEAAREFPTEEQSAFLEPNSRFQNKKRVLDQENGLAGISSTLRHMLNEFNSLAFVDFLESLTGIEGLITDPHLRGGGVHQVMPGGKLAIHADVNVDRHRCGKGAHPLYGRKGSGCVDYLEGTKVCRYWVRS